MKIYTLKRTQSLPVSIETAWDFFTSPRNLSRITPARMGFVIRFISGEGQMHPGQLIQYRIQVFPFLKTNWVTEITHVNPYHYFIDEQRFGPYALWHHQHHFREVEGGVEMRDEVYYAMPFGLFGRLANLVFVERQVNAIFDYRYQALQACFSEHSEVPPV